MKSLLGDEVFAATIVSLILFMNEVTKNLNLYLSHLSLVQGDLTMIDGELIKYTFHDPN